MQGWYTVSGLTVVGTDMCIGCVGFMHPLLGVVYMCRWTSVQDHVQWPDCHQQNSSWHWGTDISGEGGWHVTSKTLGGLDISIFGEDVVEVYVPQIPKRIGCTNKPRDWSLSGFLVQLILTVCSSHPPTHVGSLSWIQQLHSHWNTTDEVLPDEVTIIWLKVAKFSGLAVQQIWLVLSFAF